MRSALTKFLSRPGMVARVVGAVILLQLIILRALSAATQDSVTFAGHELAWGCSFKQQFGIPCPNCGITRSIVFALHGQLDQSWKMNPAGPMIVIGAVLFCAAMFLLMRYQQTHLTASNNNSLQKRIALWTSVYGALVVIVLIANWIRIIA